MATKKTTTTEEKKGKTLQGVVVSDKMDKTIVVAVKRFIKHPKYQKYYGVTKRYKAHDEANAFKGKIGEKVMIRETRPISKDKHFTVVTQ